MCRNKSYSTIIHPGPEKDPASTFGEHLSEQVETFSDTPFQHRFFFQNGFPPVCAGVKVVRAAPASKKRNSAPLSFVALALAMEGSTYSAPGDQGCWPRSS